MQFSRRLLVVSTDSDCFPFSMLQMLHDQRTHATAESPTPYEVVIFHVQEVDCLCGEGAETFLLMQLACKLKRRRVAIQGAHDDVMGVLEKEVMREAPPDRRGVTGHQGTGPVLTGSLSRGERDTGEKMKGATRRTENARRFRYDSPSRANN